MVKRFNLLQYSLIAELGDFDDMALMESFGNWKLLFKNFYS